MCYCSGTRNFLLLHSFIVQKKRRRVVFIFFFSLKEIVIVLFEDRKEDQVRCTCSRREIAEAMEDPLRKR